MSDAILNAPSNIIITLQELIASNEYITFKEQTDLSTLQQFLNPTNDQMRTRLLVWATAGFPVAFTLFETTIDPPEICSDGTKRSRFEYIGFLLKRPLGHFLRDLEAKVPGVGLSYSTPENKLCIHCEKMSS